MLKLRLMRTHSVDALIAPGGCRYKVHLNTPPSVPQACDIVHMGPYKTLMKQMHHGTHIQSPLDRIK